ncbi:MAG TPA: hypothetical protein VE046_10780 [Steroidobacteraceae bacterium]|nr:hypothetical protein [Steroidobacteraceae bacterium]
MISIDDRLAKLFGSIDVDPDFDVRLMARVRAAEADRNAERLRAERQRAQEDYLVAGMSLERWRRAALRMLSLDTIAAVTLMMVLAAALPRVLPKFDAIGFGYLAAGIAALIAIVAAIRLLYPRVRLPGSL